MDTESTTGRAEGKTEGKTGGKTEGKSEKLSLILLGICIAALLTILVMRPF